MKSRVDKTCRLLDVSYKRLTIRDQRTRWGSCSRQGTLSFNWRLIMFSDIIIDYVILHEAAHLREMNHSAVFWKIVEKYCPYYKVHRKWLRVYGQQMAHSFKI